MGSSSISRSGFDKSSFISAILVRSPPENSPIFFCLSAVLKPKFLRALLYSFW